MVLNIQGNQTEPETTIGRFGLEKKDPTLGISLPEGLYDKVDTYLETETLTEPSVISQTDELFSKKPEPRPRKPIPNISPKIRPGSVSPIDKIAELNYLLEGKRDPSSKKSQVLSGLNSLTETGQKAIKGFMDNAAGGKTNLDPVKDAWCAAFVAHVLSELGADPLKSKDRYDRLRADKYKDYGSKIENFADAKEGDLVVFDFDGDGKGDHVTFYAGDRITSQGGKNPYTGGEYINVVGGNHDRGEVSLRENNSAYVKSNVLAIRRITYNDIDFEFTQKMAEQDPVFKQFIPDPEYALNLIKDAETPSFDKGGLAEDDQMGILGFTAQGVQQEVDKYVDRDAEPAKEITFKDAAKFVAELTPVIGDAMAAKEVYDELQKDDPNYLLAGALGGATIIGLIPGIGDAAASAIKAGARKTLDIGKRVEVDPDALGSLGGNIRLKPKEEEVTPQLSNIEYQRKMAEFDKAETVDDWQENVRKYVEKSRDVNPTIRTPELEDSTKDLLDNKITREQHLANVDNYKPVDAWDALPREPSSKAVVFSLNKEQRKDGYFVLDNASSMGVNKSSLKIGDLFNGRLDIPAYNRFDTWIVTGSSKNAEKGKHYAKAIHYTAGEGESVKFISSIKTSEKIGTGEKGKTPYATVQGYIKDLDINEIRNKATQYLNDPEWTQVGFDPRRQGGFYVRAGENKHVPVREASEVIQIGPLVLAKNAKLDMDYTGFNEGGTAMKDQMEMAFMDEGGIADDGMDVDPVSGNEVPPGSLAEEVRDDIPAQLSEGEYVVPADVVRYYGVKFFEDLRDQAKMGLAEMEANGRIGGEPVPAGGPINDSELSPQEMQAIQEMMGANMNEGGQVQNPYLQQQQLYSQPRPAPIDEKRNTTLTNINPNPVESQMPMQSMASGGQVQGYQPGGPVTPTQDQMMYAQNPFDPFNYGAGYSFMGGQPQQQPPVADTPAIPESMILYGPNGEIRMFTMPLSEADTAEVARLITEGYSKTKAVTPPTIGGNGGGVNTRPPVPKPDPNAWAENITDPVAWADENLGKKDDGIIKLGQSVARTRALAIIAEAEGNDELAELLRGKARKIVENNKALQFVPEGGINGTSIASALKKDKDYKNIVDRIFKTKKSDPLAGYKQKNPKIVNTKQSAVKSGYEKKKKKKGGGYSITGVTPGGGTSQSQTFDVSAENAAEIDKSAAAIDAQDADSFEDLNKGGLMKKKGKKK